MPALIAVLLAGCSGSERPTPAERAAQPVSKPAPAEPPAAPKRLYARKFVSRLRAAPSIDAAQLGYLRAGTVLTAKTSAPVGFERCRRDWYEVAETGGFACDGREVIAFDGDTLPDRQPTAADRSAPLPYRYAYNRRAGTPMYKRLPTEVEALFYEDGIITADAGLPIAVPTALDAGVVEEQGPATLAELAGERGALVRRKLNAGFFVSLDRDFDAGSRRYWRSMSNGYIPYERMAEKPSSDFEGVELASAASLPLLFISDTDVPAFTQNEKGRLQPAGGLDYHARFQASERRVVSKRSYELLPDGRLVGAERVTRIEITPRPKGIADDARWIDVDLSTQSLVAYEGDRAVYATLVSTGKVRKAKNPELSHATPTGRFRILSKHVTTTMDGDHAIFGAYSLEDVPYVQFFQGAYAMHGAFWHDKFGRPASHGCINLAPKDALWLFNWTSPTVPRAWHAAYPAGDEKGTWLVIRGTTPGG